MSLLKHLKNCCSFGFEIFTAKVKYKREIFCDYVNYVIYPKKIDIREKYHFPDTCQLHVNLSVVPTFSFSFIPDRYDGLMVKKATTDLDTKEDMMFQFGSQ